MPLTEVSSVPPPYVHAKDSPASQPRPPVEITRERSATPVPPSDPAPPTPTEKVQKSTGKSSPQTPPPSSPAPAEVKQVQQPELEQYLTKAKYGIQDDDQPPSTLDVIHMDTFNQILELDEDEDTHDFSQPMVWAYFEQAETTFENMKTSLKNEDLESLSSLGHFLKGSSAALGLSRVQDSCEKIQHLGHLRDEEKNVTLTAVEALAELKTMVKRVQIQYQEAETWLKEFFAEED